MSHNCKHLENLSQGKTPLHLACSSGVADIVHKLAQLRADFNVTDPEGRGCLQFARQCQGDKQTLASWLKANVAGIQDTNGTTHRSKDKKSRGSVCNAYRLSTGPACHQQDWHQHGWHQDEWHHRDR